MNFSDSEKNENHLLQELVFNLKEKILFTNSMKYLKNEFKLAIPSISHRNSLYKKRIKESEEKDKMFRDYFKEEENDKEENYIVEDFPQEIIIESKSETNESQIKQEGDELLSQRGSEIESNHIIN